MLICLCMEPDDDLNIQSHSPKRCGWAAINRKGTVSSVMAKTTVTEKETIDHDPVTGYFKKTQAYIWRTMNSAKLIYITFQSNLYMLMISNSSKWKLLTASHRALYLDHFFLLLHEEIWPNFSTVMLMTQSCIYLWNPIIYLCTTLQGCSTQVLNAAKQEKAVKAMQRAWSLKVNPPP